MITLILGGFVIVGIIALLRMKRPRRRPEKEIRVRPMMRMSW